MAYDPQTLRKLQLFLVDMLLDINRVCREHDICYWLDSGTALGAARHEGFIPWDDDIDVGMPADDYWRFLEIAPGALGDGYVVSHPGNNSTQSAQFAKVWKRGTVFQTHETADASFEQGIFIDVFRYDVLSADDEKAVRQLSLCSRWQKLSYLYHSRLVHVPHAGFMGGAEKAAATMAHLACRLAYSHEKISQGFDQVAAMGHDDPSPLMFNTAYSLDGVYERDCLMPTVDKVFEGHAFPCPARLDDYLQEQYGDWRQLPPAEARVNHAPERLDFGVAETSI